jgi:hypothetical protein
VSLADLAAREAQGRHGRPEEGNGVPVSVRRMGERLHLDLDYDWSISEGWLVMRQWESPTTYRLVYARLVEESRATHISRGEHRREEEP